MGKRQSPQQVVLGKRDSCMKVNENRTNPHTMHKNKWLKDLNTSSKWLKDLNVKQDTIKPLEKYMGKTFSDNNQTSVFLGQFPKAIEKKEK